MIIYIYIYIYKLYTVIGFFFKTEIPPQLGKMSAAVFPKNFHFEQVLRFSGPQGPRCFTNRPSQVHHNLSQFPHGSTIHGDMVSYLPTNLPYKKIPANRKAKYTTSPMGSVMGNEIQIMKLDRFLQFHQVTQFWFQQKNRLPITNKHTVNSHNEL